MCSASPLSTHALDVLTRLLSPLLSLGTVTHFPALTVALRIANGADGTKGSGAGAAERSCQSNYLDARPPLALGALVTKESGRQKTSHRRGYHMIRSTERGNVPSATFIIPSSLTGGG